MIQFQWSEYIFSSSLQLKPHVLFLLESVEPKRKQLLELGLHEALVNAVVHGNYNNPEKIVRVRRIVTPNWFIWQIQDNGKGIKNSQRVFSLPTQLDAESGRGLFLIYQCFDDIRWSKKGNRLQVAIRI